MINDENYLINMIGEAKNVLNAPESKS